MQGEGLGRQNEKSFSGIKIMRRIGEGRTVNVGNETELHRGIGKVTQRVVGHFRPEIRAADADVDHVLDRLAGVAFPFAAAHAPGEG